MSLLLSVPPAAPVVTLAEMKLFLRVDHAEEDGMITELVAAATQHLEGRDGWLNRALVQQSWILVLDTFPKNEIRIPLPPLQAVTSVEYYDQAGDFQVVPQDNYYVDVASTPGWLLPVKGSPWPATSDEVNSVRVRFTCGYPPGDEDPAANVPAPIKTAIKRIVATHYGQRETVVVGQSAMKIPDAAEALLAPYRVWQWS